MKEKIQFTEEMKGTEEDFVALRKLDPNTLLELDNHSGRDVAVIIRRETWLYRGPYAEEDHDFIETHVFGTLLVVGEQGITCDIKAGEVNYGQTIASVSRGKMEYPFRRHQFQLRRFAEIVEIDRIEAEGQTFQFGQAQIIRPKELSA